MQALSWFADILASLTLLPCIFIILNYTLSLIGGKGENRSAVRVWEADVECEHPARCSRSDTMIRGYLDKVTIFSGADSCVRTEMIPLRDGKGSQILNLSGKSTTHVSQLYYIITRGNFTGNISTQILINGYCYVCTFGSSATCYFRFLKLQIWIRRSSSLIRVDWERKTIFGTREAFQDLNFCFQN